MFTGVLKQFLKQTAVLTAFLTTASVLLVIGLGDAHAAPPAPLSCSISPANGTATAGVPYTFSGVAGALHRASILGDSGRTAGAFRSAGPRAAMSGQREVNP
jgi:hypothetical protein